MNENTTSLELRLLTLLHQARDEHDSAARAELNKFLREDAEARRLLPRLLVDEQALVSQLREESIVGLTTPLGFTKPKATAQTAVPTRPTRWLQWRALTAAAAGLVIGLFSASVVFGIVTQQHVRVDTVLLEGFENAAMPIDPTASARRHVWAGEMLPPIGEKGRVKPAEGKLMAVLPPHDRRRLSYAFRFFDVSSLPVAMNGQTRQIEVTARFHGETPGMRDKFQICLAAFAEDVAEAREIWTRNAMDDQALLHVTRTVKTEPDASGWTTVHSVIDVPEDAKVLLVSFAAGALHAGPSKTEHYLDDVQVRLITSDPVLP